MEEVGVEEEEGAGTRTGKWEVSGYSVHLHGYDGMLVVMSKYK